MFSLFCYAVFVVATKPKLEAKFRGLPHYYYSFAKNGSDTISLSA
jgi:hypothetical protein